MAGAVLEVDALIQQELLCFVGALEDEFLAAPPHNAVLHLTELELEYLLEVILLETAEHDYFVDAVHELRRELALCGLGGSAIDLLVDVVFQHPLAARGCETYRAGDELAHLFRAEIRRQEYHAPREINFSVVAQRQRSLVKYAQQQLPQRVGRFLDLIEQNEGQLILLGVILVQVLLG